MKYYIILLISAGFFISGCAKLEEGNLTEPKALTVHKPGIMDIHSTEFHGNLVRQNNWQVSNCQQCHGANFKGAGKAANCTAAGCHTGNNGPLACNTCHGNFDDPSQIAPPRDTHDSTSTTRIGVGAHVSHLYDNDFSVVRCSYCHQVPHGGVYVPGHIDTPLPAEITFSSIADTNIASNATHDYQAGTCSNVYCHGNFEFKKSDAPVERQYAFTSDKMTGNNKTVIWTKVDDTQAPCGSCHGLPPDGHIAINDIHQCTSCHPTVVDINGDIIDKTKHINGKVDYSPVGKNIH